MMRSSAITVLLLAASGAAADCPPVPEIGAAADAAYARMRSAPDPGMAAAASATLWALWVRAPDEQAQALLDEGMGRRAVADLAGAVRALDVLVAYCPDYAEGWNQRAFARFLAGDYEAALPDLDRALALRPRHLGALTGRALTLVALGRIREGQDDVRRGLELNPWLAERRLLDLDPETGRRRPPSVDL